MPQAQADAEMTEKEIRDNMWNVCYQIKFIRYIFYILIQFLDSSMPALQRGILRLYLYEGSV